MVPRSLIVVCVLWSLASRSAAERPPAVPAVEVTAARVEVAHAPAIATDALFDVGDTAIKAAARPLLDAIGKALAKDPSTTVTVVCHTDDTAPDNDRTGGYNLKLSRDRADAVVGYLAKRGVATRRLVARGYGRDKPIEDNASDDGKRANRRLEILVAGEVRPPDAADLVDYTRTIKGSGALIATIATTQGTLHCQLFDDKAPATVANFVGLATGQKPWTDPRSHKTMRGKPFYDGLTFHRVIPRFVIQGGDPAGNGSGGPGYTFGDELAPELTHKPGALAMANAGPGTNGSQFFIDAVDAPWLNNHHTIFGQCKELEVIGKITAVPRDTADHPTVPVVISKITIAR